MDRRALFKSVVVGTVIVLNAALGLCQDPGTVRRVTSGRIAFCWCPPGEFQAGSSEAEPGRDPDERQGKIVLSSGFWIGQTEITEAQWNAVDLSNVDASIATLAASSSGDHYPKTRISWNAAAEYCDHLNKFVLLESEALRKKGKFSESTAVNPEEFFRLPTEAEWEYACRAGTSTAFSCGDQLESISAASWFRDVTPGVTLSQAQFVGKKTANPFGLLDVHGNAWEWCRDSYELQRTFGTDPEVLTTSSLRVHRGGSWRYPSNRARSANRDGRAAEYESDDIGFRIVLASKKAE